MTAFPGMINIQTVVCVLKQKESSCALCLLLYINLIVGASNVFHVSAQSMWAIYCKRY